MPLPTARPDADRRRRLLSKSKQGEKRVICVTESCGRLRYGGRCEMPSDDRPLGRHIGEPRAGLAHGASEEGMMGSSAPRVSRMQRRTALKLGVAATVAV